MSLANISIISSIFTVFGFVISLATVVFLYYQCQLLKSSLRTQSFQNMISNIISIDLFFADQPHLKLYVHGDWM